MEQNMNLREYIDWCDTIDCYKDSDQYGDTDSWAYTNCPLTDSERKHILQLYEKKIKPNIEDISVKGNEGYDHIYNDVLQAWADRQYKSNIRSCGCGQFSRVEAKIQVQQPGEQCDPHIDLLPGFLDKICQERPALNYVKHSLQRPAVECFRIFIALEDHVDGQIFDINGHQWKWRAGDQIKMNPWTAIHYTKNVSDIPRPLIKITGARY